MGWTGVCMDMAMTKKMVLKDMEWSSEKGSSKVLAHANGRGGLWILREIVINEKRDYDEFDVGGPYVTATFVKMEHKKGETFYKEMDIDVHPYNYDCPSSWLKRIQPQYTMGKEWLEKAVKIADAMKIEIVAGMDFTFNSNQWKTEFKYSSVYWACRTSQGKLFKIKTSSIKEVLAGIY